MSTTLDGYPGIGAHDQVPQFTRKQWKILVWNAGIQVHPPGVESYNAIGVGAQYRAHLQKLHNKALTYSADLSKQWILPFALKVCNDTAILSELLQTLLVLVVLSPMGLRTHELLNIYFCMKTIVSARKEAAKFIFRSKIDTTLKRIDLAFGDLELKVRDEVFIFREKPIKKWVDPYLVQENWFHSNIYYRSSDYQIVR